MLRCTYHLERFGDFSNGIKGRLWFGRVRVPFILVIGRRAGGLWPESEDLLALCFGNGERRAGARARELGEFVQGICELDKIAGQKSILNFRREHRLGD